MKKFISIPVVTLFLLVFIAGMAQAATIFKKNGFTYKLNGDFQLQFRQDPGVDQDLDLEYDDLELKNGVSYKVDDELTLLGRVDFGFKKAAEDPKNEKGAHLEEAYLGAKFKNYTVIVGKTDGATDNFGVNCPIEKIVADHAFDAVGATSGDDLILAQAEFGNVIIVASHELEADSEKSSANGTFSDLFVSVDLSGFEFGAAYQVYEPQGSDSIDLYGVSLAYDASFAYLGVDYSVAKDIQSVWNICVKVPLNDTTKVQAGYVSQDFDSSAKEDVTGWYANAIYHMPSFKKISFFAEISDDDKKDSDMGFLAGARLKF